jgi:hypothetical protein
MRRHRPRNRILGRSYGGRSLSAKSPLRRRTRNCLLRIDIRQLNILCPSILFPTGRSRRCLSNADHRRMSDSEHAASLSGRDRLSIPTARDDRRIPHARMCLLVHHRSLQTRLHGCFSRSDGTRVGQAGFARRAQRSRGTCGRVDRRGRSAGGRCRDERSRWNDSLHDRMRSGRCRALVELWSCRLADRFARFGVDLSRSLDLFRCGCHLSKRPSHNQYPHNLLREQTGALTLAFF